VLREPHPSDEQRAPGRSGCSQSDGCAEERLSTPAFPGLTRLSAGRMAAVAWTCVRQGSEGASRSLAADKARPPSVVVSGASCRVGRDGQRMPGGLRRRVPRATRRGALSVGAHAGGETPRRSAFGDPRKSPRCPGATVALSRTGSASAGLPRRAPGRPRGSRSG
jgi:hypothetical protein